MSRHERLSVTVLDMYTYTVATAPDPALTPGGMIYVSNGKAGTPVLAYSNGTNWIRVDDGTTAIAAS